MFENLLLLNVLSFPVLVRDDLPSVIQLLRITKKRPVKILLRVKQSSKAEKTKKSGNIIVIIGCHCILTH